MPNSPSGGVGHAVAANEVLFTLLAERYERRSAMVTSNLVFSQWDWIFRTRWPPPRRSTAQHTTRSCLSSTYRAFGPTRHGPRHRRHHRRLRLARTSAKPSVATTPPTCEFLSVFGPKPSIASAATVPSVLLAVFELVELLLDDRFPTLSTGECLPGGNSTRRQGQSLPNPLGNSMSRASRSTAMTASSSSAVAESSNDSGRLSRHVW